ncbi:MAG: molybdopterin-guanine dinucleotide biosynthesis protein B [Candidatus Thermoplasmatota archaeon]|nr:molybdopterin-guanine dinucleotide biosynthesis protein B [Candidatus Thermoplasmatota archaeon]
MIIVALIGLKKSGKTTTAEALIREFRSRGYRVGAVKVMTHSRFTVGTEGKDTWRHKEAGAEAVISLSLDELAYIEKREEAASLDDALVHLDPGIDVLICEGLTEDRSDLVRIVVARSLEELDDTFRIRGFTGGVLALTGIMANGTREHPEYPVYNCTVPGDLSDLADLIIESSGK